MPSLANNAFEQFFTSSDEDVDETQEDWMVTRTKKVVAAAATTEVSSNRGNKNENGQKLIYCPPVVTVIRSRHSGAKHWGLRDGVPCCAPGGAAFKAQNFDVAGTH